MLRMRLPINTAFRSLLILEREKIAILPGLVRSAKSRLLPRLHVNWRMKGSKVNGLILFDTAIFASFGKSEKGKSSSTFR